jgi:hypothetical protein
MTEDKQARADLSYVRAVLDRAESADNPATIYFLWAVLTFIGFAMIDYLPEKTGLYWMIVAPLGGLLSGYLGWRAGRATGQASRREGVLQALHWTGMMAAILLLVPLAATHGIGVDEMPRLILLIVAIAYYTAGVHLDRRLLWISIVLGGCYLFTVYMPDVPRLWTITGAMMAGSLAAAGILTMVKARRQD